MNIALVSTHIILIIFPILGIGHQILNLLTSPEKPPSLPGGGFPLLPVSPPPAPPCFHLHCRRQVNFPSILARVRLSHLASTVQMHSCCKVNFTVTPATSNSTVSCYSCSCQVQCRVRKTLLACWHCQLESFCASGKLLRVSTKLAQNQVRT